MATMSPSVWRVWIEILAECFVTIEGNRVTLRVEGVD